MTDEVFGTPDADGWYEWKGVIGFRPAGKVDYVCRDGYEFYGAIAEQRRWEHESESDDIVKWRPVLEKCASGRCADRRRPISPYCERCEPDL